jgi:hypothetical protein
MRTIAAVNEDSNSDAEDDKDKIAAFQNQSNTRFPNKSKRRNSMAPQRNNQCTPSAGSNSNRNSKYCFYSKIQNHTHDECPKKKLRK